MNLTTRYRLEQAATITVFVATLIASGVCVVHDRAAALERAPQDTTSTAVQHPVIDRQP